MLDADALRAHADRIRGSGVLGRSPLMQKLFDFLLECSVEGRAPKEIEVAVDAFGKGADFDVSQDAMVRVYIHKLRRKLEEFYVGPGAAETVRLSIPKGEYRFAVDAATPEEQAQTTDTSERPPSRRKWLLPALAASVVLNAVAVAAFFYMRSPPPPTDDLSAVRSSPVWAPVLDGDRTIFVVVGDYYIFGETDDATMEVRRLVREFDINSPQDLEAHLTLNPDLAASYMDLELAYLPTSAAFALRDVMPVLVPANRRVRVVTMSQLNPAVIKSADIIYLGYLSGLGMLADIVFAGSRLAVGDTYDEIIDNGTQHHYISQEAVANIRGERKFHDYGYFATFNGPSGNHIIVIAGTRDVAAMHMAETLTTASKLQALTAEAGQNPSFEALYEVYGMDRLNLAGKLLLTSPIDSASVWTGEPREVRAAGAATAGAPPASK